MRLAYTSAMRLIRSLLQLVSVALLAACGQTGALYLPDEGVQTPVEVRTAAEAAPAPQPVPPPKPKDENQDGDPPQAP